MLLSAAIDGSASIGSLVKAGPHFERRATNGHVAPCADSAKSTDLKPVRGLSIDDERGRMIVCVTADLREQPFRLGLDFQGNRLAPNSHDEGILELGGQSSEPFFFGYGIVIEIGDDVGARDKCAAISGAAQAFPELTYIPGFPLP